MQPYRAIWDPVLFQAVPCLYIEPATVGWFKAMEADFSSQSTKWTVSHSSRACRKGSLFFGAFVTRVRDALTGLFFGGLVAGLIIVVFVADFHPSQYQAIWRLVRCIK